MEGNLEGWCGSMAKIDELIYYNHFNEKISFSEQAVLQDLTFLFSHKWKSEKNNEQIINFTKDTGSFKIPIAILKLSKERYNNIINMVEKDIRNLKSGKLVYGDWYLPGYFSAVELKTIYNKGKKLILELEYTPDNKYWIKNRKYIYKKEDYADMEEDDYTYDFPYSYSSVLNMHEITNDSSIPCNHITRIYGPVINPCVIVGGYQFKINVELYSNEYLDIDTFDKTVIKTTAKGEKVNAYSLKDKDCYIYQKIDTGTNSVIITPDCNVDITLIYERSEPEWMI